MISIGPFSLSTTVAVAFLSAVVMFVVAAYYDKKHQQTLEKHVWWSVLLAVLAGRVSFVAQYWDVYSQDFWSILNVKDGGFSLSIGVGVLLMALLYLAVSQERRPYVWRLTVVTGVFTALAATLSFIYFPTPTALPTSQFQVVDLRGQPVDLKRYQGRPLVLNLWASWCPPCRAEMPILEHAQQQNTEIDFVFVNQGESLALIQQFLTEQKLSLKHVLSDVDSTVLTGIQSRALPTTLFINERGQIVDMRIGEVSQASLASYLKLLR